MSESVNVVLVGHCTPDAYALKNAVRRAAPHARIVMANSDEQLAGLAVPGALLLVNRALDGEFRAEDGVALIAGLASPRPAAMLISNFPDAQAAAVAAGALPGFGKKEMGAAAVAEKIAAALTRAK